VGEKDIAGVTELDGSDGKLVPFVFVAVTVNVYGVPFASSVTYTLVPPVVAVRESGDDVTV
jgi:hypothetical protein